MLKYVLYVDSSSQVFDQKFVQIFHLMLPTCQTHVTYLDPLIDIFQRVHLMKLLKMHIINTILGRK